MGWILMLIAIVIVLFFLVRPKKRGQDEKGKPEKTTEIEAKPVGPIEEDIQQTEEANPYRLNWPRVEGGFPYKTEITAILKAVAQHMEQEMEHYQVHGLPVNPYAFALAVRQAEGGRAGREFGILHPQALEEVRMNPGKGFDIQIAWFLGTFRNDVRRWNMDELANVGNRKKKDFHCFICYFGAKYAPIGAENDPTNLNRHWVPNVKLFYERYHMEVT